MRSPRLQSQAAIAQGEAVKRVLSAEPPATGQPLLSVPAEKRCRVIRRLNRFVVLVDTDEGPMRVHINNTGRLLDVLVPGREACCRRLRKPGKLSMRLFAARYGAGRGCALLDTGLQEEAFAAAVERGLLPGFRGCRVARRRPRLGSSFLDFLLDCGGEAVYVETKSAVLLGPGAVAMYPDCPSERGRRHIRELIEEAGRGKRVALVFIAAFPGAKGFKPNREADPEIARLVAEARERGVQVEAIGLLYDDQSGSVALYAPRLPVLDP